MSNIKKVNKILMATVAILLCLVLISTSLVSGIFAKFITRRTMETSMKLKKFGVTLTMTQDQNLKNAAGEGNFSTNETLTDDGYVFTISNVKMAPGMVFPKAVKFAFSGEPTVPVQIKITPTVTYNSKVHTQTTANNKTYYNYYIPANTIIDSIASNGTITYMPQTYYMPLGFNFSYDSDLLTEATTIALNPWSSGTTASSVNASTISNAIANGIKNNRLGENTKNIASVSGNVITIGNFPADTGTSTDASIKLHINSKQDCTFFHMGFYYPFEQGSGTTLEKYDKISTYLAEHTADDATITISYKVEIVQVS